MTRTRNVLLAVALVAATFTSTATTAARADTTVNNWGLHSPTQSPPGLAYPGLAYDSARGRTVLFGGGSGCCNEPNATWEWDGKNWTSFTTFPSPPSSLGPGMAYDSARGVTVLLANDGTTWEWNGQTWTQRVTATSPPARVWTAMSYDSVRHVMVVFGGNAGAGTLLGDTWTYDGNNWTKMTPASSPSPRDGHAMTFDSGRGVVVLFGGRAPDRTNDTWEWDGSNWTQRTASNATGTPYPRWLESMAYDAQIGETVMFGGDHLEPNLLGPINDTWLWDGTTWTRDWTSAVPVYRAGQAMAYESGSGRIALFGGTDQGNPGVFYDDTWEFGPGIVTPPGNPALTTPALSMYMGSHPIGTTVTSGNLRIFGGGTGPTLISSITATGDFGVAATDCPIAPNPLAVNAFCSVEVSYTPTACGLRTGALVFADNSAAGLESINLEGGVSQAGCDADLALIATSDLTVNATSPAGATIDYRGLQLFDLDEATPPPITCSPPLNSVFPIGTTLVTCSATDSDDVTSAVSATFHVTVNDTDLALANVPADMNVPSTSSSGAVVNYTPPTVLDEDANAPAVTCSPASGSLFPIAITTVTCSTSDSDDSPGSVTASFKVMVGDADLALSGMPPSVTVQADYPGGAVVGYVTPKALDEEGGATVTCDHSAGFLYPVGTTTTTTCQAYDPDDVPNTVTASFTVTVIDTDIGVSIPPDITVNATGPSGAVVNYATPAGADEDGNALTVSCTPASGSVFPIGTDTVTCTNAPDPDDTPASRSITFHVIVNDTDLGLAAVADITAVATSSAGATVTFTPPAVIDEDSPLPAVTCNWPTTYTFAVGTTTVICQVTDYDDPPYPSTVQAIFHVTVVPDIQLMATTTPTTATAHTTVGTTASVTNIGATSRKVTISYAVDFTDASGNTTVVATNKAVVTVAPGQTVSRPFSFAVKNGTPPGSYSVVVSSTDDTGSVSQTNPFNVS